MLASRTAELSALGVAHLAGLNAGVWTRDGLVALAREREEYRPRELDVDGARRRWRVAVARSRGEAVGPP